MYEIRLDGQHRLLTSRIGLPEVERVENIQAQRGEIFCTKLLGQNKVRCAHCDYDHELLIVITRLQIFTTDPNHIKSILATDFSAWEKGAYSNIAQSRTY